MLLCTTLLSIQSAYAMDLHEALTSAYQTNESLKAAQQKFLNEAENFPQALSRFLPDINMTISSNAQKDTVTERGPSTSRNLQVKQNLFRGGQDAYGIKVAQAAFLQSKATFYAAEQKVITDSAGAYLDLCAVKEKYNIAVTAVESAKQTLDMVQERLKVGESTITEVAATEAKYAKAESDAATQYGALVSAKANFSVLIGVEASDDIAFPDIEKNGIPDNLDALKAMVEKGNFDLMTAKSQLSQTKDGAKQAQGALLPSAELTVSEGKNFASTNGEPTINTRSVSTAVSLTIPILDRGGIVHSAIRQKKAQSRQAVYILDYQKKQVNSAVISEWESLHAMKVAIQSYDEIVRAQTLAVEGMRSGYSVGTQTILDVLEQQDKLNQYKAQAVDARNQYLKSSYKLQALVGKMTAKQLNLKVKYFNPDYEFRNVKHKIVGF